MIYYNSTPYVHVSVLFQFFPYTRRPSITSMRIFIVLLCQKRNRHWQNMMMMFVLVDVVCLCVLCVLFVCLLDVCEKRMRSIYPAAYMMYVATSSRNGQNIHNKIGTFHHVRPKPKRHPSIHSRNLSIHPLID
jgi:hypothetical protein